MKTHEPQNKLQVFAYKMGYRTASSFATAVAKARVASYGNAFAKWNGHAGKTQYDTLYRIAKFLGATSVDEVFDP